MIKLTDHIKIKDGLGLEGQVIIKNKDGKILVNKKNHITNQFKYFIMALIDKRIQLSLDGNSDATNNFTKLDENLSDIYGEAALVQPLMYIKFGDGGANKLPSEDDIALFSPIADTYGAVDPKPLNINQSLNKTLKMAIVYEPTEDRIKIQYDAVINNNTPTQAFHINELGLFSGGDTPTMFTHLVFDDIYLEPDDTQTLVYTIYLV